jgi:hypothetical protein
MKTYKYTDSTNTVVHVIDVDGISRSSCLASTLEDGAKILPCEPPSTDELNTPLLVELDIIDRKSIRAIREGNTERVKELEAQAVILRGRLMK